MGITISVKTRELDGPGFSDWMVVCYTIHNPDGFDREQFAIDLPRGTVIMPPYDAAQIEGAPIYELDGRGPAPAGRTTRAGQTEVEICFVARRGPMRRGEVSLERRRKVPVPGSSSGAVMFGDGWEPVPYDGAPRGIGPNWVPPALALAPAKPVPHEVEESLEHAIVTHQRLIKALDQQRVIVSPGTFEVEAPPKKKR